MSVDRRAVHKSENDSKLKNDSNDSNHSNKQTNKPFSIKRLSFKKLSPLVEDLKDSQKRNVTADIIAGLTVGVMLIPQGMAYAVLAGLPPIYGLYGGLIPLVIYAFIGSSRQLAIGPVAVSSVLVAEGISNIPGVEVLTPEFVGYALAAGLFIGLLQFLFGLLRMGFLVNFLSQPVIAGFTTAAAFIILASQLSDFLGFPIDRDLSLFQKFSYAITHLDRAHLLTVVFCTASMLLMWILKKFDRRIPSALAVVIPGTLLTWFFGLDKMGLEIIGSIPQGLPAFEVPYFTVDIFRSLFPTVVTVTLIGIIESIGIAKTLENKHQSYIVRPNRELIAIGLSKMGGALFQAMPTSASFTRSAINNSAGARTTLAGIVTAVLIGLTLLLFTSAFYYLPKAILAAIILLALPGLIEHKEAIRLWKFHRSDFFLMLATFLVTLIFGIEEGVEVGVVLSILNIFYRASRPHIAVLGIMPGKTYYRNIDRFDSIQSEPEALIVRFDNQLFFANASYFKDKIRELVLEENRPLKCFFLDAKSIIDIDSSGLTALRDIHRFLRKSGIDFYVCGAIGPIRDRLTKSGFTEEIGADRWFLSLHEGIVHFREREDKKAEN